MQKKKSFGQWLIDKAKSVVDEVIVAIILGLLSYVAFRVKLLLPLILTSASIQLVVAIGLLVLLMLIAVVLWRRRSKFIPKSWIGETISEAALETEAANFVGRDELLSTFSDQLEKEYPTFNVLGVYGIGGVGKSRLLRQYQYICITQDIPCAIIFSTGTLGKITILEEIANQLLGKIQLEHFLQELSEYRSLQEKVSKGFSDDKPQSPMIIKALAAGGAMLPATQPIVATLGRENVETLLTTLHQTLTNQQIKLLTEPEGRLSQALIDDLNLALNQNKLVLLFDSLDDIKGLEEWLRSQFVQRLSRKAIVVVASRLPLSADWGRANVHRNNLTPLALEDSEQLLRNLSVDSTDLIHQIIDFSEGLPLALILAAELSNRLGVRHFDQLPKIKDLVVPLVNELTKVADPDMLKILQVAAVCDWFNSDLLAYVFEDTTLTTRLRDLLQKIEYIQETGEGHLVLHSIVKKYILEELSNRSPSELNRIRTQIAEWFIMQTNKEKMFSPRWRTAIIEAVKYRLQASEESGLEFIRELFELSERNFIFDFCQDLVNILKQIDLSNEGRAWQIILQARILELQRDWASMKYELEKTIDEKSLSVNARSYLHLYHGRYLWRTQQWNAAEVELEQNLILFDQIGDKAVIATTLHALGDTYRAQGKLGKALEFCTRSVQLWEELKEPFGLAKSLMNLGLVYRGLGQTDEALTTLERCVQTTKNVQSLPLQAKAYYLLAGAHALSGNKQQVQNYLSLSISLLEKQEQGPEIQADLAIATREMGMLFLKEGNYDEALGLFQRSRNLSEQANSQTSIILADLAISYLYILRGEINKSKDLVSKTAILTKQLKMPTLFIEANLQLIIVAIQQGEYDAVQRSLQDVLATTLTLEEGAPNTLEGKIRKILEKNAKVGDKPIVNLLFILQDELKNDIIKPIFSDLSPTDPTYKLNKKLLIEIVTGWSALVENLIAKDS